jgi:hypothetical protein
VRYQFLLSEDALDVFSSRPTRQREQLKRAFLHIAEFPDDADSTWDESGFLYIAKRFQRWNVIYRVDGPVKQVHIARIQSL